jgi:hypothetical protein
MWKTEDMKHGDATLSQQFCTFADWCSTGHTKDEVNESYGTPFYTESD